jgi:antirestriction protein ArdC
MIPINPDSLRDHEVLAASEARVEAAEGSLKQAEAAHEAAVKEVSAEWDSARTTAAASVEEAMAGAERHAAAVCRANFAARIVGECEKRLGEAKADYESKEAISWHPVLQKGKEIRLQAAAAADRAREALAEAQQLYEQGAGLILAARSHGLAQRIEQSGLFGAVKSEADEKAFWKAAQ